MTIHMQLRREDSYESHGFWGGGVQRVREQRGFKVGQGPRRRNIPILLSKSDEYNPRNALAPTWLPNLKYKFPKQNYKICKN